MLREFRTWFAITCILGVTAVIFAARDREVPAGIVAIASLACLKVASVVRKRNQAQKIPRQTQ